MRVLVVADDDVRESTVWALEHGLQCVVDQDDHTVRVVEKDDYDLVVIDLAVENPLTMLTELRGKSFVRPPRVLVIGLAPAQRKRLKTPLATNLTTPVGTPVGDEEHILVLNLGADDYVPRPVNYPMMHAKAAALVRRANNSPSPVIRVGDLELNTVTCACSYAGKRVLLTPSEHKLLALLMMRRGTVVSKLAMIEHLYRPQDHREGKILDVYMCKIRRKLLDAGGRSDTIETIWGRGYWIPADGVATRAGTKLHAEDVNDTVATAHEPTHATT
jgi:two-component system, cell cycle response regulator CtrA